MTDKAQDVCREFYGYELPWVINAASQQLGRLKRLDSAEALGQIAVMCELGLPTMLSVNVFLAGVKSRVAAVEIAESGGETLGKYYAKIKRNLRSKEFAETYLWDLSEDSKIWLELLRDEISRSSGSALPIFSSFTLNVPVKAQTLHVRRTADSLFLADASGMTKVPILSSEELPFASVADDLRIAFECRNGVWKSVIRDPKAQ